MALSDTERPDIFARRATIGRVVRQRYLSIMVVFALVFVPALWLILTIPAKYDAVTLIQVDPGRNPMSGDGTNPQAGINDQEMDTEIGILKSLDVARAVVRRLGLQNDPEFTAGIDDGNRAKPSVAFDPTTAVATELRRHLKVDRPATSYILEITFRSRDPAKSARIVNAFAEAYLDARVQYRMSTSERQSAWFAQRARELETEARQIDARLAEYRARSGLVAGAEGNAGAQPAEPLTAELATAEAAAAAARSSLNAARLQLATGGFEAISAGTNSQAMAELRRQRAAIVEELDDITARNGERHPQTIAARQKLASIDAQIRNEGTRAMNNLEAEAGSAEAQAESLRQANSALEGRQAQVTRNAALAGSLEREAESKRAAYDRMAQMAMESAQAARNAMAPAAIIDPAQSPRHPAWPSTPTLTAAAAVLALMTAYLVAAFREGRATGMRSAADVEAQLGVGLLASVPKMKPETGEQEGVSPADTLLDNPVSMFAEAFRNLQASVAVACPPASSRVIALTSAVPEEGKTTTALAFARILALGGARTLLIDCDVRRAALRSLVTVEERAGLPDVLSGAIPPTRAITPDHTSGLDLMLVNVPDFSGAALFSGEAMAELLEHLRKTYAFIVLDLPPLLGLADARFLSIQADATILVIRWNSTRGPAVNTAMSWLRADGANVIGAVYTMVDPRAEAVGGYHYSKKYGAYYHKEPGRPVHDLAS